MFGELSATTRFSNGVRFRETQASCVGQLVEVGEPGFPTHT
jgi:hypothetical protein